jgi:hypothetical protein
LVWNDDRPAPKIWNDNFKRRERNMSNTELKKVKGRVQNKHNTEAEWLKSVYVDGDRDNGFVEHPFIPLAGELIIYDPDSVDGHPRFKIGDPDDREGGRRNVDQLPFVDEDLSKYQTKNDESLKTTSKEIVGAINELNEKIGPNETGAAIVQVESEADIPDDGTKLYRYTNADGELSHLVEVIEAYHAGGENQIFEKTTTANGGSVLNATTILTHFDPSLSNFVTFGAMTEVYALHYAMPFSGIRIGKSKGIGTMEVNMQQEGILTFRKYFGYNGSTGAVTSYDADSVVVIDGTTYNFTDDTTELALSLSAGPHTITSFDGSSGRIILASFVFSGEEYYTYDKSQYLARLSDVDSAKGELLGASDKANTILGVKSKAESAATTANSNSTRISTIENSIGDTQVFTLNPTGEGEMPSATSGKAGKLWKWEDKLYESVNIGEGVSKEFVLALPGTSELTDSYLSSDG